MHCDKYIEGMVSPSRICKTSNKGFDFGNFSSEKDSIKTNRGSKIKTSTGSQLGHSQLLSSTRFYLDIRNRFQLNKVEEILRSYGGKIEVFFRRDIGVIVTDKQEWMGNGNSPSSFSSSVSSTPSPSTVQDQRSATTKSRVSAMLEKVSQKPASSCSSPLELAQKWRIPVLSVKSLWKWIEKIEEAYMTKLNEKKKKKLENKIVISARNKAPFIKIESIYSQNIPEFLELEAWPSLNLDGKLGQCPFHFPSPTSRIVSNDQSQEIKEKFIEVKNKVSVELIQYDTDFRIKDNLKHWQCEENKGESTEIFDCPNEKTISLHRINNQDEVKDSKHQLSPLLNGYNSRGLIRESSQELLKVQCNGLISNTRTSKLLSPSGSDVLPLPSSRRSTRRASASWCGSTRELAQLSPTDSEIENIRRSDSSFETHDPTLDSPGITLRPKGQLWLPVALIGTTAEENGNCIRKRFEYSIKQSENAKLSNDLLGSFNENNRVEENETNEVIQKAAIEDSNFYLSTHYSQIELQIKKDVRKKDICSVVTRHSRLKNQEMNRNNREGNDENYLLCDENHTKNRNECKKRSLSACSGTSPLAKRMRTMSTNSVHSLTRRKKLSPEEKLLQDNKEYFKMEVLNTKLRSTESLINVNQYKEAENSGNNNKPTEKIDRIIIRKIKIRKKRRKKNTTRTKKTTDINILSNGSASVKINGVFKKKRQTELMKLCHEAESFMFGESNRHVVNTIKAEADLNETVKKKSDFQLPIKTNAIVETFKNCQCKVKTRKKRRSHAEAFIHDNIDYYKFETPGSRLRYQGNFTDVKSQDKDFIYTLKQKKKETDKKDDSLEKLNLVVDIKKENIENFEKKNNFNKLFEGVKKILYSFESIPTTEPWYEVYKRQDEGLENYYPLLSNPNDQPFLLPYELPKNNFTKTSAVSDYYKRRRKKLLHFLNHPRKSPRCHASTLAILSNLKKRKRRSGTNISLNQILSDSPPNNINSSDEKIELRVLKEKKDDEGKEILDFLNNDITEDDYNEIFLEPLSDSENKSVLKSGDSVVGGGGGVVVGSVSNIDDEDLQNVRICGRGKKLMRIDSINDSSCNNERKGYKNFLWQKINSEDFFKGMIIETQKKSGLIANIETIIENYKNCTSMEDSNVMSSSNKVNESLVANGPSKNTRRKKKKARKINKTGWDNRKSRKRTSGKVEVKDFGCSEVKENRIKTKVKVREDMINFGNVMVSNKKRMRRRKIIKSEKEEKPVLRSHLEIPREEVHLTRINQNGADKTNNLDIKNQDYSYVLRVKKVADSCTGANFRLKCSRGRYNLQKRRLVLNRKKKRVRDYSWTTR